MADTSIPSKLITRLFTIGGELLRPESSLPFEVDGRHPPLARSWLNMTLASLKLIWLLGLAAGFSTLLNQLG
ncbi:hypothetical protein [Magnetococcus sp. PR-3]|uniref:hypothetical protein n=1 Tax=Magnetococcus sp. PR-3 TaxID=3120355 RepID=UPI002FCE3D5C